MQKVSGKADELRPEYDLKALGKGVRGKYYRRAQEGTNLVLIEPDLMRIFPNGEAVNRALWLWLVASYRPGYRPGGRNGAVSAKHPCREEKQRE